MGMRCTVIASAPENLARFSADSELMGDFMGKIISGIYEGIRNVDFLVEPDYVKVTSRSHASYEDIMRQYKDIN